jgi:phage antirepressor YoqD-like protein
MNELDLFPKSIGKTMTISEMAIILNVSHDTIRNKVKEFFPELLKNGITTKLNEIQVTKIKMELEKNPNIPTNEIVGMTDLEALILQKKLDTWKDEKIKNLQLQLSDKTNQVNRLIHDNKTYTTTEIAKEMNLKSAIELNKILEENGIQYKMNGTWVLTAKYSNLDYESIKQQELDNGTVIYNRHWTGKGRDFILSIDRYGYGK